MPILSYGKTDIGLKRQTNQDSIYVNTRHNIFVVADGMGGHNGGDFASSLAVKAFPEYLLDHIEDEPVQTLKDAITYTNKLILEHSNTRQELRGMGTTVVVLYFTGDTLHIANVGDSRAYLINRGNIFQLSRDHSLIQEKITLGVYTREEAALDPMKNVLARTVGFEEPLEVDVYTYKVNKNDMVMICSDGLHGLVSEQDIIYLVNKAIPSPVDATAHDLEKCVNELISAALHNGGNDNVSIILSVAK